MINIILGIMLLITSLLFTFVLCVAAAYKEEIWSCITFEDEEDLEEIDDDLDEYRK